MHMPAGPEGRMGGGKVVLWALRFGYLSLILTTCAQGQQREQREGWLGAAQGRGSCHLCLPPGTHRLIMSSVRNWGACACVLVRCNRQVGSPHSGDREKRTPFGFSLGFYLSWFLFNSWAPKVLSFMLCFIYLFFFFFVDPDLTLIWGSLTTQKQSLCSTTTTSPPQALRAALCHSCSERQKHYFPHPRQGLIFSY